MKSVKRIYAILLCLSLIITVTACAKVENVSSTYSDVNSAQNSIISQVDAESQVSTNEDVNENQYKGKYYQYPPEKVIQEDLEFDSKIVLKKSETVTSTEGGTLKAATQTDVIEQNGKKCYITIKNKKGYYIGMVRRVESSNANFQSIAPSIVVLKNGEEIATISHVNNETLLNYEQHTNVYTFLQDEKYDGWMHRFYKQDCNLPEIPIAYIASTYLPDFGAGIQVVSTHGQDVVEDICKLISYELV